MSRAALSIGRYGECLDGGCFFLLHVGRGGAVFVDCAASLCVGMESRYVQVSLYLVPWFRNLCRAFLL